MVVMKFVSGIFFSLVQYSHIINSIFFLFLVMYSSIQCQMKSFLNHTNCNGFLEFVKSDLGIFTRNKYFTSLKWFLFV